MKLRHILGGIKSYLPFLPHDYTGTGGTVSAHYCYSVWLRHAALIHAAGIPLERLRTMIELGPGDSIGVGLAALLTGVERYLGCDVVQHNATERNQSILRELVELYRKRAPGVDDTTWPELHPKLGDYGFPVSALTAARVDAGLTPVRIAALHEAITQSGTARGRDAAIRYVVPWFDSTLVEESSVDLILGQGVLQDIDDTDDRPVLERAFRLMTTWLRPGGVFSHEIELGCEGMTLAWNEHWSYPDWAWTLVRGRRPYYKNRAPMSRYLDLCQRTGIEVLRTVPVLASHSMPRERLARRFRGLPQEDLLARSVYVLGVKR